MKSLRPRLTDLLTHSRVKLLSRRICFLSSFFPSSLGNRAGCREKREQDFSDVRAPTGLGWLHYVLGLPQTRTVGKLPLWVPLRGVEGSLRGRLPRRRAAGLNTNPFFDAEDKGVSIEVVRSNGVAGLPTKMELIFGCISAGKCIKSAFIMHQNYPT